MISKCKSVLIVVISYNDFETLNNNINNYLTNFENDILVIDNSSDEITREKIEEYKNEKRIKIIFNNINLGIAKPLNQAVVYANTFNYSFILTMDQDSYLPYSSFSILWDYISENESIGIASPKIVYNREALVENTKKSMIKKKVVITSGSLIRLSVVNKTNGYNEDLFLDLVDFDFSLKIINSKFQIYQLEHARILHELGEIRKIRLLFYTFEIHIHSPMRRYYLSKNFVYMFVTYIFKNPLTIAKLTISQCIIFFQIILFEKKKIKNIKEVFLGFFAGIKQFVFKKKTKRYFDEKRSSIQ